MSHRKPRTPASVGGGTGRKALAGQSSRASFGSARSIEKGSFHHSTRPSGKLLNSDAAPDCSRTGPRASKLAVASAGWTMSSASNETPPHIQALAKPTLNQRMRSGAHSVVGAEQLVAMAGLLPGSSALSRSIKDRISDFPRSLVLVHTVLSPIRQSYPQAPF